MLKAIAMPANYCDMLIKHSPPVFSHSPPTGYLAEYGTDYNRIYDPMRGFCRPQVLTPPQQRKYLPPPLKMPASPKRSCLVHRNDENVTPLTPDSPTCDEIEISSPNKKIKKKVVFADDQGLSLTEVRIMTEPSNVPPLWSLQYLAHITQGMISPVPTEQWTVDFKQPASEYLDFRRKLEENMVSLENVIVKENESVVVGTIKVKNISFLKEVIVRTTWDHWKCQEDVFCTYSQVFPVGSSSGTYILYDTFSFKITLPPSSSKLEFCICYRSDEKEFWDNNQGQNYTLSKKSAFVRNDSQSNILSSMNKLHISGGNMNNKSSSPIAIPKFQEATHAKMSSWSEFAAWRNLENNCPYW